MSDRRKPLHEALAAAKLGGGSGGGGTSDYTQLTNKPSINGTTLSGNKTSADLGLQSALTFDSVPTDGSTNPVESNGVYDALAEKQDTIDSSHKLSADLVDDSTSTNKLCRFDSATGDFYVGGVRVLRVMDYDSYAALATKENIWYATYPTPSQNSGRSLESSTFTKNENSDGEDIRVEAEEPAPDEGEMR